MSINGYLMAGRINFIAPTLLDTIVGNPQLIASNTVSPQL